MAKFQKVYIEISDICGCECSFCPSVSVDKFGPMDLGLYSDILSQIRGKTRAICLHLLGDPLANLNLDKYLDLAFKNSFKVDLVTTGKYLNKHDFTTLCKAHQISFSLSAFIDKNGKFKDDYIDNLLDFCKFKKEIKSDIFVNFRVQKHMINEPKFKMIKDRFERFFGVKIDYNADKIRLDYKTFLVFKEYFEWKKPNSQNPHKYCHGLISQIGIKSSGSVVPCCIDARASINLGSLKEQSLTTIINSPKARAIIEGFKAAKAVENLCQKCEYKAVLD
ncbi:radical SAM/SPASM domain-containing protein [Campylobacter porcelli]|uniref:radical SAM/SPASM domain-containing protein n=1 Tax=Campylobacter porcelli TaxID=1660073 RepID=UPI0015D89F7F|nr:radical SAM/SPASM domain-containing protein [Campylobacter sp. P0078]